MTEKAIAGEKRGLRARSKSYAINWSEGGFWEPCLTWKPCLVFSYDPEAELYSIIWLTENGEETLKGKRVSRYSIDCASQGASSLTLWSALHKSTIRKQVNASRTVISVYHCPKILA